MSEPGALLRRLREAKGCSLTRLAREAKYNKGYLSKIENGERPLSLDKARRFDRILETGGALTRAVATRPPAPEPPGEDEGDPWAAVVDPADDPAPNSSYADEWTVAAFDAHFETWRMMGHSMSPAHVLPGLRAQCFALRDLLGADPRPDLLRTAARYAEYTGWMFQEVGDDARARAWTSAAVGLAARAGDVALASYALVRAAEIALYAEDGRTMVELSRRACTTPGATAAVRSLAAQREAQGHAIVGELSACLSALDTAAHWQEVAAAEAGPHYGTTSLPDPIAIARGWSLHHLDRSAEAAVLLACELERIPATSVRSRVRFGVRLALAEIDHGDVDGACSRMAAMLADLRRIDSATVRVDVRNMMRLLAKHSGNPTARALRPELAELLRVRQ